jgi:SAM-dependent methyltransferase
MHSDRAPRISPASNPARGDVSQGVRACQDGDSKDREPRAIPACGGGGPPDPRQRVRERAAAGSSGRGPSAYVSFWGDVGATFPSLKGAASTRYYFDCERLLFERYFPDLNGRLLLKTDLWDEAKNTEILRWAAEQGARPVGVDIALEIVQQARGVLERHRAGLLVSDVRALPFRADRLDLVYSMGTIEHFPEYERALREIFRVLRPRGRAIVGVPNTLDPFLRPLMVCLLNKVGLYAYGREKSFTPRALRRLLESAGFHVTAQTGILFLPGWLRMLDLWCHTRWPRLGPVTGWLVRPFAWLYRRVPAVRRHGYLIACIAEKPG